MTFRLNGSFPIVDSSGRLTAEAYRAFQSAIEGAVVAALAQQAATAAQTTANTAVGAAQSAQDAADAAAADAATRQPASTSLTNLSALSGTGLVEKTGADAFTTRGIGAANASDIPTRSDADARYVKQDQTGHPSYTPYGGQTVGAAYSQAQVQQIDDKLVSASNAIDAINSKLQTIGAFT